MPARTPERLRGARTAPEPAHGGAGGADGWSGRFLGPIPVALLLTFAILVTVTAHQPRVSAVPWPLVAVDVALPLWWTRTRAAPPAWSLALFLAVAAAIVALDAGATGTVILMLVGTAVAVLRLPDRDALVFGAASLALGLLAGLRYRLAFGGGSGLLSAVTTYAVGYGALIASRQRVRHQWETERLLAELKEEHRRLEAAHAQLAEHARDMAELAASEERNRIAREIHDVLAHALTVIIVQAEAAAVRLRTDPQTGAEQVRTVAALARQALQEARLSVAAIRADPGGAGLDALRRLCEDATRLSGMRCHLVVHGAECPLPAPVALAAYRILQEALTNARRHGEAQRVEVAVSFTAEALTLTVTDDGHRAGTAEPVPGSGLRGMRERAEGVGGTFRAEALPSGFAVCAELPLAGSGEPERAGAGSGRPVGGGAS